MKVITDIQNIYTETGRFYQTQIKQADIHVSPFDGQIVASIESDWIPIKNIMMTTIDFIKPTLIEE